MWTYKKLRHDFVDTSSHDFSILRTIWSKDTKFLPSFKLFFLEAFHEAVRENCWIVI